MERTTFDDILCDVREIVKQAAHPRRGTLRLSPEVAAALEAIPAPSPIEAPEPVSEPAPDFVAEEPVPYDGPDDGRLAALRELDDDVRACAKCRLCDGRTQTVFGTGNPFAELVFVGEAPGFEEDRQGKPFVGRAGQLLTDIIEKGMNLKRREVYICNVIKCRPPENRNPRPDEIEQCEPYLIRQLELIRPKVICALGSFAAQTLLKTTDAVARLRGKWHFYHDIPLRVTYHPAYLLRNPADKRKTWMDVLEVLKLLRGEANPKSEELNL